LTCESKVPDVRDELKSSTIPFYESNQALSPRKYEISVGRDGVVHSHSEDLMSESVTVMDIPLDYSPVEELDLSKGIVHVTLEGNCSFIPTIALYERTKEIQTLQDVKHYTRYFNTYYCKDVRHICTRSLDYQAYRLMLINEAVRHQKIRKYNPRQYLFFSCYLVGKGKARVSIFSFGRHSKEKGPFFLYRGPLKSVKKESKFKINYVQEPSLMTPFRESFVRKGPDLILHKDIYRDVFSELLSVKLELVAPLHRSFMVKVVVCPVHSGSNCGLSIHHKSIPFYIPPICYNMESNVYEYVMLWLTTRYEKRNNKYHFKHVKHKEEDHFHFYREECRRRRLMLPTTIMAYASLYFIT